MSQCPQCGMSIIQKNLNRHLKNSCYGNPRMSSSNSEIDITMETTKKVIKMKNVAPAQMKEIATSLTSDIFSLPQSVKSVPSIIPSNTPVIPSQMEDILAENARLKSALKLMSEEKDKGSLTINQTIINQTVNQTVHQTVQIFDSKSFNLYDHVLNLCGGDTKKTISKIFSLVRGKKTKKNKYDHPELEKLFPSEVFSKILTRGGKDIDGNYKYEYVGENGKELCGTDYIDKVMENIITNGGTACYNKAIEESNDRYEKDQELGKPDQDCGATNYLMEYSGIYGNQGDDLMSKISDYRKLRPDPKHVDNTVARITNRN